MPLPAIVSGVAFSFGSTSAAGSALTTYPTGSASGDLLLLGLASQRATSAAHTHALPAGWNSSLLSAAPNGATGTQRMSLFWRFRGAETNVTTSWDQTDVAGVVTILALRRATVHPTLPIRHVGTPQYDNAAGTVCTCPGVTTTAPDCLLFEFATAVRSTNTAFTFAWTAPAVEQADNSIASSGSLGRLGATVATDPKTAPGATATRVSTASASVSGRWGMLIAVQPPPPGMFFIAA